MAAQQAGRFDEAVRNYRAILRDYPNIAEMHSNLGAALAGEGLYAEAIAEYKRALRLKPNAQVRLNLALAYYKTGDFATAAETLQVTHKEIPQNTQVVTLLADCFLRLGRNKDVIDLMTPVQRNDPDNPAYVYLLGTALVRNGDATKGQWIIDKILKNGDSAESLLLMGTTKYMAGDFAEARQDFEKATNLNPNLPDVFAYYGMTLLATGDQANARKAFMRELEANPNNFDSNLRLGVLLRQDEDNVQALRYLHKALEVRPGDPGVRFQIASLELAEGHLDTACRDLETLVRDNPRFIEAHVALATVYFRLDRKADGVRERAIFAKLNAARQASNEVAAKTSQ
jgi:tetratricopeptide (TPR) repeat protein